MSKPSNEAGAPAWKVYNEAIDQAGKVYGEAIAQAWKVYDEAVAQFLEGLRGGHSPGLEAREEAVAPAEKEDEQNARNPVQY